MVERDGIPLVPTVGVPHGPPLVHMTLHDQVAGALGSDATGVAVVHSADDAGTAILEGARSVSAPVAELQVAWSMDAPDVAAQLAAAGAETVVVSLAPKQLLELMMAADAAGLDATWVCPAHHWIHDLRAQLSDEQLARLRVIHVTPTADQSPHDLSTLAGVHGVELTDVAAHAYWSGWIQLQAVSQALSDGAIDRAELAAGLEQPGGLPLLPQGIQVLVPTRQGWGAL
jgi:hypothetical protein